MNFGGIDPSEDELISVVSTLTVDHIPQPDGPPRGQPGGPAHYIVQALQRLAYPYRLITGEPASVQVISGPDGEAYLIPAIPPIPMPARLDGRAVMLSPIIGEVDIDTLPEVEGLLVVDIQGFVREPGLPTNRPGKQFDLTRLLNRADIVKASEHELSLLTPGSLALLPHTVTVETRGEAGARIRADGECIDVPAVRVDAPNTIGAGDIFLAAFVVAFLRGAALPDAGSEAARFTRNLLQERISA